MDREAHLLRRVTETGGRYACRGCGGLQFQPNFMPTVREVELVKQGAFDRYDDDPYLFAFNPAVHRIAI